MLFTREMSPSRDFLWHTNLSWTLAFLGHLCSPNPQAKRWGTWTGYYSKIASFLWVQAGQSWHMSRTCNPAYFSSGSQSFQVFRIIITRRNCSKYPQVIGRERVNGCGTAVPAAKRRPHPRPSRVTASALKSMPVTKRFPHFLMATQSDGLSCLVVLIWNRVEECKYAIRNLVTRL